MSFIKKTRKNPIVHILDATASTLAGEITDLKNSEDLFRQASIDAANSRADFEIQAAAVRQASGILKAAGVTL